MRFFRSSSALWFLLFSALSGIFGYVWKQVFGSFVSDVVTGFIGGYTGIEEARLIGFLSSYAVPITAAAIIVALTYYLGRHHGRAQQGGSRSTASKASAPSHVEFSDAESAAKKSAYAPRKMLIAGWILSVSSAISLIAGISLVVAASRTGSGAMSSQSQASATTGGDTLSATASVYWPNYSRADVAHLLDATYEFSSLLQTQGQPAIEAATAFVARWDDVLLSQGEPEFQARLGKVRAQVEVLSDEIQTIENKYSHYEAEIRSLHGEFMFNRFKASDMALDATRRLAPNFNASSLVLLESVKSQYSQSIDEMNVFLKNASEKAAAERDRFRRHQFKED